MAKKLIFWGSLLMAAAVGLGAFGAHALETMLEESGRTDTYETAVLYHFIHAVGLLIIGLLVQLNEEHTLLKYAAFSHGIGILIFSGSLYVLCLTGIGILGAITPIGGVLFILGWVFLMIWTRR